MNENCKDPYTFFSNSDCIPPPGLKEYIYGYKFYIKDMNEYCEKSDNVISNTYCNNFVENNKFIQNTEIQTNLKKKIPDLCKVNVNDNLNELCINKYNLKPDIVKERERNMMIGIGITVLLLIGGGGYMYSKNKKKASNKL
jgi:hypothetical protein